MGLKKLGAAAVILNDAGHVLLVKHGYGQLNWEIPGGGAEPNETILQTVIREVLEETGLVATPLHTTGIYYSEEVDGMGFVFRCTVSEGAPRLPDSNEITDVGFWPPDALPRPISDWTIQRIHDALTCAPQPLPVRFAPPTFFDEASA